MIIIKGINKQCVSFFSFKFYFCGFVWEGIVVQWIVQCESSKGRDTNKCATGPLCGPFVSSGLPKLYLLHFQICNL